MPLDPQMQTMLDEMRRLDMPGFSDLEPQAARELMARFAEPPPQPVPVAAVSDRTLPGPAGPIPIRAYTPEGDPPFPVVVYFHGGGWVIGNIDSHDDTCRRLATLSGSIVVSVDYRLAPEHRFPAAVDDCFAATQWVAEHAAELGGDPDRLAVAGDSAGGNLAAVVSLLARDVGSPRIQHQLLIYPAVDMTTSWPSHQENGEGYFLTLRDMEWFSGHYVADPADREDFRASPLRASSHAGLPSATIITAEFDPLRDEGEAYGEKLRSEAVPAEVRRYDGVVHGFFGMGAIVDAGRDANEYAGAALKAALAPQHASS
jgi:acetyl esterase